MTNYLQTFRADGSRDVEIYKAWYAHEFGAYLASGRPHELGHKERKHNAALRKLTGLTAATLRQAAIQTYQGEHA